MGSSAHGTNCLGTQLGAEGETAGRVAGGEGPRGHPDGLGRRPVLCLTPDARMPQPIPTSSMTLPALGIRDWAQPAPAFVACLPR